MATHEFDESPGSTSLVPDINGNIDIIWSFNSPNKYIFYASLNSLGDIITPPTIIKSSKEDSIMRWIKTYSASTIGSFKMLPWGEINYNNGSPGSFFTISGKNFPINEEIQFYINGKLLGTVLTDNLGNIEFGLDTINANEGRYFISFSNDIDVIISFFLDSTLLVRPQDYFGPTFPVPEGIALTKEIYIPILFR